MIPRSRGSAQPARRDREAERDDEPADDSEGASSPCQWIERPQGIVRVGVIVVAMVVAVIVRSVRADRGIRDVGIVGRAGHPAGYLHERSYTHAGA